MKAESAELRFDWVASIVNAIREYRAKTARLKQNNTSPPNAEDESTRITSKKVGKKDNWLADKSVGACMKCQATFSTLKRRHHCRLCGKIFCKDCCHKAPVPDSTKKVRICDDCSNELQRSTILATPDSIETRERASTAPLISPVITQPLPSIPINNPPNTINITTTNTTSTPIIEEQPPPTQVPLNSVGRSKVLNIPKPATTFYL